MKNISKIFSRVTFPFTRGEFSKKLYFVFERKEINKKEGLARMEMMGTFAYLMMIGLYVFIMIILWRFMRAHETIAESMKVIAEKLKINS